MKKPCARLEEVLVGFFSTGICSFTWNIKNTGVFSKWARLRLFNTLAVLQALLLSCSGHKTKWPSFSKKIPEGFLFSIFFFLFFFKYHAFNWNNPKEWWWRQDFTQNCIPVDSINNPVQFHTSATGNLVKSCASKHCIPPKHLCLLVTCETLAKG